MKGISAGGVHNKGVGSREVKLSLPFYCIGSPVVNVLLSLGIVRGIEKRNLYKMIHS